MTLPEAVSKDRQQQIPERWLYWTYQNADWLPDSLTSVDGQSIVFIDRGKRNFADGPDFLDAQVLIGKVLCRGDVEFHVRPKDWHRHGHQHDRRYTQVILHCFWDAADPVDNMLATRFPHVAIKDQLTIPPHRWQAEMQAIENSAPEAGADLEIPSRGRLADYSEQRFLRRCDRFLEYLTYTSAADLGYAAMAEALGYRQNQSVMFNLMLKIPASEFRQRLGIKVSNPLSRFAALLIYSGLCPPPQRNDSPLMAEIIRRLAQGDIPLYRPSNWRFGNIRPANQPLPRLAALAQWLPADDSNDIFQALLQLTAERKPLKSFLRGCEDILRRPLDISLQAALLQLKAGGMQPKFTIGQQRIRQFLVSGLLPLLWAIACRRGESGLQLYIESLYEQCPGCESPEVIRHCFSAQSPDPLKALINRSAFYQQGVLEFFALRQGSPGK